MKYITSDLAKVLGVTTNTIRRYEKSGFLSPHRDSSNYRYYENFDVIKTAAIRLYIKCGFSHSEINEMLFNSDEEIASMYETKLAELDAQMERIKRLRHWLKDNLQLLYTAKELDSKFYTMQCPPLRYVLYSSDYEMLTEKKRLETIKNFMYDAPEVQLINIYRYSHIMQNKFIPNNGWAIKEMDIEKFNMRELVDTSEYIETYPQTKCLYSTLRIPCDHIYDNKKSMEPLNIYMGKVYKYLDENSLEISGDIVEFFVNTIGSEITVLVCIPISEKGSLQENTD